MDTRSEVFERAVAMVGEYGAEKLREAGLLAEDVDESLVLTTTEHVEPTHWKLRARWGSNPPQGYGSYSMKAQLKRCASDYHSYHSTYSGPRHNPNRKWVEHVEIVFDNHRVAASQATMARGCNLDVELVPCVLLEVEKVERMMK